jgi:prepilin-type N-terminal cleavage/methylation domain-containing protein
VTRRRSGLTLVELAVVLAVIVILTGAGVPAFGRVVTTSRMQAAAYQLAGDLKLMRENAILYQADLTMYLCTNPADQRTFYCFELLPRLDSTTGLPTTALRYTPPTDGVTWTSPSRFVRRNFPYAVTLVSTTLSAVEESFGSWKYKEITFHSGSGGNFRGSPSSSGTIVLVDQTGTRNWYVFVDSVGRVRVSANPSGS